MDRRRTDELRTKRGARAMRILAGRVAPAPRPPVASIPRSDKTLANPYWFAGGSVIKVTTGAAKDYNAVPRTPLIGSVYRCGPIA
jgi:hypothetical protein